ncbi:MAG TPA: YIP1 family protein [Pyrinomonadaceae bacterium]|nr:YIP1 family protein [Pyrinomonadaceae bacterium]
MLRYSAIVVFIIGIIVLILGITKIVPNTTGTGVSLLLLGGLLFGLSFVPKPDSDSPVGEMSPIERLTKIFYAPAEVFQNLRRHPRWLVAILIMTVLSAVYSNAFMYRLTPERITNYAIDKTLEMPMMNEQARAQVESTRKQTIEDAKSPVSRVTQAVNSFVGYTFLYAFFGLVFWLFALAMGGKINFWQAFSASVYAAFPIAVINRVLSLIILFIKDPTDIHPILGSNSLLQDNLGILVTPADNPVLYVLLSAFGILQFYWIFLMATGLKNAGERVSPTTAWTATIVVWLIGVTLSVVMALIFPSFFS